MAGIWQKSTERAVGHLPPRVRDWVSLESSMTERISRFAGRPIDVEVVRQATGRLLPDERCFFPSEPATVREVCLSAEGWSLLIARTAFTSRRLRTHPTILRLGNRALGSLLFANGRPSPYRAREFARLGADSPLFGLVRKRHEGLSRSYWARRTLFLLFDEPLLVTEIFMPELLHRRAAPPRPAGVVEPVPAGRRPDPDCPSLPRTG